MEQVVASLGDPVYITLDLDGLDPSVVPGTGTPEPGGLPFRQVVRLIEAAAAQRTVVGADIVELSPIPGQQVSEYTAAKRQPYVQRWKDRLLSNSGLQGPTPREREAPSSDDGSPPEVLLPDFRE